MARRSKIKHPHSKSYVQPFGTKGWRFYNPYGDVVWEGSLDQLSSIYDIADADVGDEAAFFLVEAAQNADRGIKNNPGHRIGTRPPGVSQATKTFEDFNEYPSKGATKFAREIVVPERMPSPGPCRWLTYRSNKWNDGTHDYIHTITSYPRVKCAMAGEKYPTIKIPIKIREANTLTQIGLRALGFAFEYDDHEYEAKVPAGTEWFWSQTARALYLIQNKRKLVALIWGGTLNVEARGIVG